MHNRNGKSECVLTKLHSSRIYPWKKHQILLENIIWQQSYSSSNIDDRISVSRTALLRPTAVSHLHVKLCSCNLQKLTQSMWTVNVNNKQLTVWTSTQYRLWDLEEAAGAYVLKLDLSCQSAVSRAWLKSGAFPPGVHWWSNQVVASTSLGCGCHCTRMTFWTQTLAMFDVCTHVHIDCHICMAAMTECYLLELPH